MNTLLPTSFSEVAHRFINNMWSAHYYRHSLSKHHTTIDTFTSMLALSENDTIANQSAICDPRLFELGGWSRESIPLVINNICPDSITVPIVSAIFLAVYLGVIAVSVVGIIWKRKSGHIQARHPVFMMLTVAASFVFVVLTCLRFIIGRKIYPCFLFSITFWILPPAIGLPTLFRLFRIFFMYRLSVEKTGALERRRKSQRLPVTVNPEQNFRKSVVLPNNSASEQQMPSVLVVPPITNQNPETSNFSEFGVQVIDVELEEIAQQPNPNVSSPSADSNFRKSTVTSENENETTTDEDARSWITYDSGFEGQLDNKKIKVYQFLTSYKFMVAVYLIVFFAHICLWVIMGGIDEANYQNGGKRLFFWYSGVFTPNKGCVSNTNTVYFVAAEAAIYIIVEIVLMVMYFFTDRDTWGIKREQVFLVFFQIFSCLMYVILGQIEVFRFLVDYFVPYGYTLLSYSLLEIIVSVFLPILYAIRSDYRLKVKHDTELELLLKHKKSYMILLDFSRRSYCPEPILCWKDIQRYKKGSKKNRKKTGLYICETYLRKGAPLELNIPESVANYEQTVKFLTETNEVPSSHLFNEVHVHCLNDMTDVFERLKQSNKQVREMIEDWRKTNGK